MVKPLDISKFRFGIEHEFPVINRDDHFLDFSNTSFQDFDRIIEELPEFSSDANTLRTGDLGIKSKRWYIEGFERFSEKGEYIRTDPKGFEIRTPICDTIEEAILTLSVDYVRWKECAEKYGYRPARTALNPFRTEFIPHPPLNSWELEDRSTPEEQTAYIHMLTYGPDLSFSHPDLTSDEIIEIGKKLTYYSPFIVPFSYSSPFYQGELWGGYSRRTFYRTGERPSVLVFLEDESKIIPSFPTLTDRARIPAEAGRIEFKAFDCPPDAQLYGSLAALLIGLTLDDTLGGRLLTPSAEAHQHSATHAFDAEDIFEGSREILSAARAALPKDWKCQLDRLDDMLAERRVPAHDMIDTYKESGSIIASVE